VTKQPYKVGLTLAQRQLAQIVTIADQTVEGVEFDFVIVFAGMQAVEVGDAVDSEQHGLAIEYGMTIADCAMLPERSAEIDPSSHSRCG
jgi:hypothetical protein